MSNRQKKRRNKAYAGEDARIDRPVVHRYSAVDRGRFGEWWHRRGTLVKRIGIYGGGGAISVFLIVEAFRSIF